jgi:hypothetical protein
MLAPAATLIVLFDREVKRAPKKSCTGFRVVKPTFDNCGIFDLHAGPGGVDQTESEVRVRTLDVMNLPPWEMSSGRSTGVLNVSSEKKQMLIFRVLHVLHLGFLGSNALHQIRK